MKKAISILTILALTISCLIMPVPALAMQEDGTLDAQKSSVQTTKNQPARVVDGGSFGEGLSWSLDENNKLTISGEGKMPDSRVETENPWYEYRESIVSVAIQNGVANIGNRAFSGCSGLTQIIIPDSVTSIGRYAFSGCSGLTQITVPDSVKSVGESAFSGCGNIEKAIVGQAGLDAIQFTPSLKEIELLSDVTSIGNSVFRGCSGLTTIIIPQNVEHIEKGAFEDCKGIARAIILGNSNYEHDTFPPHCKVIYENYVDFGDITLSEEVFVYETKEQHPEISVTTYLGKILKEGKDFTVTYDNNVNAGTATATVRGIGSYYGTVIKEITINKAPVPADKVKLEYTNASYDGNAKTPLVLIEGLEVETDFTVTYNNNVNVGTAVATIEGIGNYSGTVTKEFTIAKAVVPTNKLKLEYANVNYDGKAKEPAVTIAGLKQGTDFTVTYSNNINVGTAIVTVMGIGNYSGTVTKEFTIAKAAVPTDKVKLQYATVNYDGKAKEPTVTIAGLKQGTDFTVTYKNNVNAGMATVTVTGIGNYNGTVTKEFTIAKVSVPTDKMKLEYTNVNYDGNAKEPAVTIAGLKQGTDFTVTYKNNVNAGTATVTITGIGNYQGTITKNFVIELAKGDALFGNETKLRIYGPNRYETSVKTADALKTSMGVSKFENIVIASGNGYADALSGAYLASVKNAPVLVVGSDKWSPGYIQSYIKDNLKEGGTVYILGGTGAVSKSFEDGLKQASCKVKRLGGSDRYATNIMVLKEAGVGNTDVLVCSGNGYADSLSASAVGKPILLVNKKLYTSQNEYLSKLSSRTYYLIGGEGAVNNTIAKELTSYGKTKRVSGANRYGTSVAVARQFFGSAPENVVFAYGLDFPDGLSGGPLAYSIDGPLLLITSRDFGAASDYVKESGIEKAATLGGPLLISDKAINSIMS